jgi:hypothetical protein
MIFTFRLQSTFVENILASYPIFLNVRRNTILRLNGGISQPAAVEEKTVVVQEGIERALDSHRL